MRMLICDSDRYRSIALSAPSIAVRVFDSDSAPVYFDLYGVNPWRDDLTQNAKKTNDTTKTNWITPPATAITLLSSTPDSWKPPTPLRVLRNLCAHLTRPNNATSTQ